MKSKINKLPKNIKARLIFNRLEKKNKTINFFKYSNCYDFKTWVKAGKILKVSNKYSKISFIKNLCIITYRSKGVLSKFKLSRHEFKRNAHAGNISGIVKK